MPKSWITKLVANEDILLTIHQNGIVSDDELGGHRYTVQYKDGIFQGFLNPTTDILYKTPSALCVAMLLRIGSKGTNEWRGPRHCLVLRGDKWTPIGNL